MYLEQTNSSAEHEQLWVWVGHVQRDGAQWEVAGGAQEGKSLISSEKLGIWGYEMVITASTSEFS